MSPRRLKLEETPKSRQKYLFEIQSTSHSGNLKRTDTAKWAS